MPNVPAHGSLLVGGLVAAMSLNLSAMAQIGPTSANDRTTSQNQSPNPKNPTRPPKVNTGIGSPDTPTDGILNEGSPPLGAATGQQGQQRSATGQQTGDSQTSQAGARGNIGFAGGNLQTSAGGSLQTMRLTQLLSSEIQLQGGQGVGTVSDLVLNQDGNVQFLLGANATNQQLFTIPAQAANFNFENLAFTLPLTAQQFQSLPTFATDAVPNFGSEAFQQSLATTFGLEGANASTVTSAGGFGSANNVNANTPSQGAAAPGNSNPGTGVNTGRNPNNPNESRDVSKQPGSRATVGEIVPPTVPPDNTPGVRKPPLDQPAHTQGAASGNAKTNNPAANKNNPAAANAKAGRTPAGTPLPNRGAGAQGPNAAGNNSPAKPPVAGPGRAGNTPLNPPVGKGPGAAPNSPTPALGAGQPAGGGAAPAANPAGAAKGK